ncbi:MAG: hypothetical protein U9Q68_05300, partial [Euryarchaeota archaeon]|nr:hypothetical protein [Euryarchaeota archaeon]
MRGSKELAAILLIILLAATALSSPGSSPNGAGVGTFGDFKVVKISEDSSFSGQVRCGLIRLSVSSDEVSRNCVISNTAKVADSQKQLVYNVTRSPIDAFNPLHLLPFAMTTLSGVLRDEYENPIKGAVVK